VPYCPRTIALARNCSVPEPAVVIAGLCGSRRIAIVEGLNETTVGTAAVRLEIPPPTEFKKPDSIIETVRVAQRMTSRMALTKTPGLASWCLGVEISVWNTGVSREGLLVNKLVHRIVSVGVRICLRVIRW